MSITFLATKAQFASDIANVASTSGPLDAPPRPPPVMIAASDHDDGIDGALNSVLSCVRTAKSVTRFLQSARRRSCSFVNPDEVKLAELERTAKAMSLSISQKAEENVGLVVRLSRQPVSCSQPYPMDQEDAEPLSHLSPFKRAGSFNSNAVVEQVRRVVSGSRERPKLTEDGTGGVYLIRESSHETSERTAERSSNGADETPPQSPRTPAPIAVFKPTDEEAGSQNNPRGYVGEEHVMREGFRPGGGAVRERIAYKLDRGFARVPRTAVDQLLLRSPSGVHVRPQSGSIQEFVQSDGDASDFRFDGSEFDDHQSQRVMLQDCRLFNCDRHEGNILVKRPKQQQQSAAAAAGAKCDVVPIDHAFVLPRFGYFREAEFAWRYWTSAAKPIGRDAVEYVAALNVDADVDVARKAGLDESSCATLRVCTMLLKRAVLGHAHGLLSGRAATAAAASAAAPAVTPKTVSALLMREEFDEPSPLERLCARALGVADADSLTDTGLIDFISSEQKHRGEPVDSFVPPEDFYERLAALLEALETFGD